MGLFNIVLDSCRFDVFSEVYSDLGLPGKVECQYSWANHTVPVFTDSVCLGRYPGGKMFEEETIHLLDDYPCYFYTDNVHLSKYVSPVRELSPKFEDYKCFPRSYDSLDLIVESGKELCKFDGEFVCWLWTGNTHQPYSWFGDLFLPCHGVADRYRKGKLTDDDMRECRDRQTLMCRRELMYLFMNLIPYLDGHSVLIWADHGELFGEDGQFGHGGNRVHKKVFEVPLVRLRY